MSEETRVSDPGSPRAPYPGSDVSPAHGRIVVVCTNLLVPPGPETWIRACQIEKRGPSRLSLSMDLPLPDPG